MGQLSSRRSLRSDGAPEPQRSVPLAPLTTLGVGGPADWFVEARTEEALLGALAAANGAGLAVTMLGGGSNVLVSDGGVRGLVIRVRGGSARPTGVGKIRADAGMTVNGLVRWTVQRGLGGLEGWAGTPGTVGGAIHGNAHFGGRSIGERVVGLLVASRTGKVRYRARETLRLEPGGPMFAGGREFVLAADFAVESETPALLRSRARASLAFRKRTQPLGLPSAGCAFRNPDPRRVRLPPDVPCAAGALLDRAGLKGVSIGGARVSEVHANFLTTGPGATASDVHRLLELCRDAVAAAFGIVLVPELILLGDLPS